MAMSSYYKNIRDKIGSDLMFMPSVAAIVRNEKGEILFQNKGNGEKWSLPAGAIELGEAPAQAVIREVWEETGLTVIPKILLGVFGGKEFRYEYPNGHKVEYNLFMFECEVIEGTLCPKDEETAELQYFHLDYIPDLAIPYPKVIFEQSGRSEVYFQWDEQWLNAISQK
ncbi:NUDIX hydrolase [Alkalihalobacterium bogoriense]|uniref:NUDIX hydrolase n=1 Tax=Alkalihalobacterium bogoriense TaxID=246272 RepID=UPI0009FC5290|nr:NUDIX domain-containing protein [Alkalihalobacterium bogoriense]